MQLSLLHGKQIAIIGGGPVGLTFARLLQQRGAHVAVYERDASSDVRLLGSTLDVHAEDGQLALAAAGLLPRFRQLARPTAERIADEHGVVLREEQPTEANGYDRPEIDRTDLHDLLLSSLEPGTVRWDYHFQGLEAQQNQFVLHFANQPSVTADVVVGANGSRSKVRSYITAETPEYSGSFVIQGTLPHPDQCPAFRDLVNGGNLMVRAGGKVLFAHTKANGAVHYYLSFRRPADWLQQRGVQPEPLGPVVQLLAEELADWAPLYHEAFRATDTFGFLPMYRVPLASNRPVNQPLTLIGDAAHAMPPYAGIGVNVGLLDALHLTEALTNGNYPTLEAAITAYEETMYDYAQQAQEQTAAAELVLHSDLSMEEMLAATRPAD